MYAKFSYPSSSENQGPGGVATCVYQSGSCVSTHVPDPSKGIGPLHWCVSSVQMMVRCRYSPKAMAPRQTDSACQYLYSWIHACAHACCVALLWLGVRAHREAVSSLVYNTRGAESVCCCTHMSGLHIDSEERERNTDRQTDRHSEADRAVGHNIGTDLPNLSISYIN